MILWKFDFDRLREPKPDKEKTKNYQPTTIN